MKKLLILGLAMVLMAFQAPAMAAASCSTTLSDGAVKVLMPGNGSGPDVLVTGQPFLLQWTDPESELGPRVNILLKRITSGTKSTATGAKSWLNQPNIGYHVALEKLVNPVNVQQFKTAKHIFVVQSSSNTKNIIQSDCFTFSPASEVFTPGLSASSPGRVWEDKSSFFQDRSVDVTKKKHTVFPNEVNIPSLYDDGNVSNAGLFSALLQEVASLRREIDTLKGSASEGDSAATKHSHKLTVDQMNKTSSSGAKRWDHSSLELQIDWKALHTGDGKGEGVHPISTHVHNAIVKWWLSDPGMGRVAPGLRLEALEKGGGNADTVSKADFDARNVRTVAICEEMKKILISHDVGLAKTQTAWNSKVGAIKCD